MRVLDLLPNLKRLFEQADGPLGLAQGGVGEAQVAEGGPLAPPVADLARNRQVPLDEVDGPLDLAQGGVGIAQIAEGGPLAPPVADLAAIARCCSMKSMARLAWPRAA